LGDLRDVGSGVGGFLGGTGPSPPIVFFNMALPFKKLPFRAGNMSAIALGAVCAYIINYYINQRKK